MSNETKISVGDSSVDFTLLDIKQKEWQLQKKLGRIVALLFYPADETLVCTKQLCSVRDNWAKYLDTGAEVIGVSPGTPEQHEKFAVNHRLPMSLLADTDRLITRVYGAHWWMPIWATRAVVVIDAKGVIRYQNILVRALRPPDDELLAAINLAKYDVLVERRQPPKPIKTSIISTPTFHIF